MSKKKSPTFVQTEDNLYALNRAAKRLARRKGIACQYVGLQPLSVNYLKGRDKPEYVRSQDGQVVSVLPYYGVGFWAS
jgi:hypothetical protein